jgi:hypothetical protein
VLRDAWRSEPEERVRVDLLRALAGLDEENAWIAVLVASASEKGDAAREEARRLVLVARGGMLDAAARLLREDDSPTFRADVVLLLGRRRRTDAVRVLLDALADPHPRVVAAAAEALEAVSGQALGYDAAAWKAWASSQAGTPPGPAMGEVVTKEPETPPVPPPPPPVRGLVPSFYGIPLASKDVVFVLDVSGSVGANGLETGKAELVRAVERLASDVRVAALFFDETVRAWHPETVPATPEAKEDLARFVRGIGRGKRTDVMTPLNAGLQIVRRRVEARLAAKEGGEPATMVVVSDGQENVRATPGEAVGDKLDRLDLEHAVVHAVVLGGRDSPLLRALARRGGGRYLVVP